MENGYFHKNRLHSNRPCPIVMGKIWKNGRRYDYQFIENNINVFNQSRLLIKVDFPEIRNVELPA